MAERSTVVVERVGSTALIKLDRPEALNAFDAPMRRALRDALLGAGRDPDVRAVVLAGEGRAFSAGADLKAGAPSPEDARSQLLDEYGPGLDAIAEMPKPVIAAVDGPAVGIALAYVLTSDLVVMAESAYLQAPFNDIGLLPDGGLSWLLPRALGYARAFELVVESRRLEAAECVALGLANRVVGEGAAAGEALAWAERLAARPALAVAATKQAMRAGRVCDRARSLAIEAQLQASLVASADCAEGIAAFLAKRAPRFEGR